MQFRGGAEYSVSGEIISITVIGDNGSGFTGNDRTCGYIVFLKSKFPVAVKSA